MSFTAENEGKLSRGGGDVSDTTRAVPRGIRAFFATATGAAVKVEAWVERSVAGLDDPEHPAAMIARPARIQVDRKVPMSLCFESPLGKAGVNAVRIV